MKCRIFAGVHLVVTIAVLIIACGVGPPIPDAGTPCPCGELGNTWLDPSGHPVVSCSPRCTDTRVSSCDDGGSVVLCFGEGCCIWKP